MEVPLQSYFRLNARGAGQFEHTLIIVDEGADLHFIEGCSAPKYDESNLHAGCVELYVKRGAKLRYSTITRALFSVTWWKILRPASWWKTTQRMPW